MIDFQCECGRYRFSLRDDLAGSMIQCPRCKVLVTIPSRDEDEQEYDGTDGADGTIPLGPPLSPAQKQSSVPPVEAVALEPVPPVPVEPVEQPAPLSYARKEEAPSILSLSQIGFKLMLGGNLVVWLLMLGLHALAAAAAIPVMVGLYFLVVAPGLVLLAIVSHYANVLEDVAVDARDELPAPLRQLGVGDDILKPCLRIVASLALCYWPVYLALAKEQRFPAIVLTGVGTYFFPAVFMTVCCSGSVLNLRPDRVFGMIAKAAGGYMVSVLLWLVAGVVYGGSLIALMSGTAVALGGRFDALFSWADDLPNQVRIPATFALLMSGIYLVHLFCWQLGMIYRAHEQDFPWVLRRHVRKDEAEGQPIRRKRRYV